MCVCVCVCVCVRAPVLRQYVCVHAGNVHVGGGDSVAVDTRIKHVYEFTQCVCAVLLE